MEYLIVEVHKKLKQNLSGLPAFCRLVMHEALEFCNYAEGKIILPSLHEFAVHDFYVERTPGRKREEVNGDTIRNALRTIKKFRGDFFKFKTVNQRIEIDMPFVRDLYNVFCAQKQLAAASTEEKDAAITLAGIDLNASRALSLKQYIPSELTEDPECNNKIINKHNKQTGVGKKLSISESFYPSIETIQLAKVRGFQRVDDPEEISKFIAYNLENDTRWEDFNPIYLRWLERSFSKKPKQTLEIGRLSRECDAPQSKNQEALCIKHQGLSSIFTVDEPNGDVSADIEDMDVFRESIQALVHQEVQRERQNDMARSFRRLNP